MKQVLSMANKDKRKEEKGAGYDRWTYQKSNIIQKIT
jgi:hypothetical protein